MFIKNQKKPDGDAPPECPYKKLNRIADYVYIAREKGERELKLEQCTRDSSCRRDFRILDSYWNENMGLTGVDPYFNLKRERRDYYLSKFRDKSRWKRIEKTANLKL